MFDAGVGSVDDGGFVSEETAFRYAIERINYNHELFNFSRLSPEFEKIHPTDSFRAANRGRCMIVKNLSTLYVVKSNPITQFQPLVVFSTQAFSNFKVMKISLFLIFYVYIHLLVT